MLLAPKPEPEPARKPARKPARSPSPTSSELSSSESEPSLSSEPTSPSPSEPSPALQALQQQVQSLMLEITQLRTAAASVCTRHARARTQKHTLHCIQHARARAYNTLARGLGGSSLPPHTHTHTHDTLAGGLGGSALPPHTHTHTHFRRLQLRSQRRTSPRRQWRYPHGLPRRQLHGPRLP